MLTGTCMLGDIFKRTMNGAHQLVYKEDRIHNFLRFAIIGGVNTVHYYFWYLILLNLGLPYIVSHTVGFILSMIGSFFLNCFFTFKTKPTLIKFLKFPLTTLTNYIVSTLSLWFLVGGIHVKAEYAAILASLLPIPITYMLTHKILHKEKTPEVKRLGKRTKNDIISIIILLAFAVASYTVIFAGDRLFADFNKDNTLQYMFFLPFLQKTFLSGQPFWSWSYGLGGDVFGQFSYYYTTSPFFYLGLFLRSLGIGNWSLTGALDWKLVLNIFKEFVAMTGLYALLRDENHRADTSLLGAITYGGCSYFTCFSFSFDFMTDAMVWVPLAILSLRRYRKTRNPLPFIIVAAVTAANSFYFGFMSFILYIIYIIAFLKPVGDTTRQRLCYIVKEMLKYGCMFVTSLALAAVAFLPAVYALFHSDRFAINVEYSAFMTPQAILKLPEMLFTHCIFLGFPIIAIIVFCLPLRAIKGIERRKTIVAAFLFLLFLTPLSGNFFNGMSYSVERWYYLFIFAVAYALPGWVEANDKGKYVNVRLVDFTAVATAILLYTAKARGVSTSNIFFINIIIACLSVLAVLVLVLKKNTVNKKHRRILCRILVFVTAITLLVNTNAGLGLRATSPSDSISEEPAYENQTEMSIFKNLTPDNNEFYRTVGPLTDEVSNSPLNYGYYGASAYNSMIDGTLHKWIKRDYNIRNKTVTPSMFANFDDRLFLESAFGVRYIVRSDSSSQKATPYGFALKENQGGNDIYQNEHPVGIDLWYDSTFDKSDFKNLNMGQRDALLLGAAMTDTPVSGLKKWTPGTQTSELSASFDDAKYTNASYKNGTLKVGANSEIDLPLQSNSTDGEMLVSMHISPKNGSKFDLTINSKKTHKESELFYYTYPISDFTFCLPGGTNLLQLKLSEGEYEISDFHVYYNTYKNYVDLVDQRNKYQLTNLKVNGGSVTGEIRNGEKGILALNIPYSDGWHAYVDGKKVETIRVNGIMTGLILEPGSHNVRLNYITPWFIPGAALSVTAAVGMIIFFLLRRKKLKTAIK